MQKKKVLQGKRFGSNEKLIIETEAYFKSKDESFYKKRHRKVREALKWILGVQISFEGLTKDGVTSIKSHQSIL